MIVLLFSFIFLKICYTFQSFSFVFGCSEDFVTAEAKRCWRVKNLTFACINLMKYVHLWRESIRFFFLHFVISHSVFDVAVFFYCKKKIEIKIVWFPRLSKWTWWNLDDIIQHRLRVHLQLNRNANCLFFLLLRMDQK